MKTKKTLQDLYSFPGFRAGSRLKGIMGDSLARIVTLVRRQKKRDAVHAASPPAVSTTIRSTGCAMLIPEAPGFSWNSSIGGWIAGSAMG